MSADVTELMYLVFKSEESRKQAKDALKEAEKEDLIEIINAADLTKDDKGEVHYKELEDLKYRKKGRLVGSGVGAILGLVGGPAGLLVTTAAGAIAGGLISRLKDKGVPNEKLKAWAQELDKGSYALLVLVNHIWVDQIIKEVADYTASVVREELEQEASSFILTVAEEESSEAVA